METFVAIGYDRLEQRYVCKIVIGAQDRFYVPGAVFQGEGRWDPMAVSLAYIVEGEDSVDKVKKFFGDEVAADDTKQLEMALRKLPNVRGLPPINIFL